MLGQKEGGKKAHRQFNCGEVKKNLCQVMKLLIAIHVSFCDSHANRWTGCSAVFLERIVHVKNEVLLEDCVREDLQKQACTP